jgi:glycosyltransferase involved in cell wall biosynthesis
MKRALILKLKRAIGRSPVEPLARKTYSYYVQTKTMRSLKKEASRRIYDRQEFVGFLHKIQPTKFSSLEDAENVILIAEKGDWESLELLLNSLIFYKKNKKTSVLINFDSPPHFIEKYGLIHNLESEKTNPVEWASNLTGDNQFLSLIYFKSPLVPLNDILNEITTKVQANKNLIMVGKIVDNNQKIIAAGHTFNVYGQVTSPYVNCSELQPEVMYCREVNAIENDFFVISKEAFLSLPESFIKETNFHVKLNLYILQNKLQIMYTPFIVLLMVKIAPRNDLETRSWESIIELHELQMKIQFELSRQTESTRKNKKIVFVDVDIPKPDQDAASVTHLWYLKFLTNLGFEVTYISAFSGDLVQKYCDPLYRLGIKVIGSGSGSELQYHLMKELRENDILFFCRSIIGKHIASVTRSRFPKLKMVFNTVDLDFLRMERQAVDLKDEFLLQESLIARYDELDLLKYVDETLVVSSFEMELLKQQNSMASIHHIRLPYLTAKKNPNFDETHSIIFVGGFRHKPNLDSVLYFIHEVWPLVRKLDSSIQLIIAGSNAPKEILDLSCESSKITILGFVDQIENLIQRTRISIAPLLYGAGTKGKVIQSLSLGIPVVASTIGVEGTGLENDENVLVADTPHDIARKIVLLYNNKSLWESLQKKGKQFVESEHAPDRTYQLFKKILKEPHEIS